MRKKLFVLVIFMILPLTTGWLNLVQFDKVSSISGIQENSDLKAESHFDGAHVIAPGGYVEVSLFGLPEFSTYFESFIIWNLTSDIGLYCLLMNYYNFLNFANNDTYICEYLGPTGDTSTSIENEPFRIPFSSNHQTNYYVVYWNNNSIAANMEYEINLFALKAIIQDFTYTAYDRSDDGFLDSFYANFTIDFNCNTVPDGIYNTMNLTDEVVVKLLTAAIPSYVYGDFLIGYNLNDFSFTVELTTDKKEEMEITLETRYHSPITESAEDSLTIKITETIYNEHHLKYIIQQAAVYGGISLGVILLVVVPITVVLVKKKRKNKAT